MALDATETVLTEGDTGSSGPLLLLGERVGELGLQVALRLEEALGGLNTGELDQRLISVDGSLGL